MRLSCGPSSVCRLTFPVKPIEADLARMVAEQKVAEEEAVKEAGAESSAQ
jgi:hypothetical protein